jgi:hypothetical protein
MWWQGRYVGTCKTLYFRCPEDGAFALTHVRILYVMYDFWPLYVQLLVTVIAFNILLIDCTEHVKHKNLRIWIKSTGCLVITEVELQSRINSTSWDAVVTSVLSPTAIKWASNLYYSTLSDRPNHLLRRSATGFLLTVMSLKSCTFSPPVSSAVSIKTLPNETCFCKRLLIAWN